VKKTSLVIGLAFVLVTGSLFQAPASANSQDDPSIKATTVFGNVTEINASAGQITIKTAAGSVVVASVNEKTTYQRMPPGETDRSKAVETSMTEIAVGDGVVARGFVAADRKSVPAQQIIVVSQSDIAKRNATQRQAWARGTKGIVSAINAETKEITVTSRSLQGASQAVTVAVDKAKLKRYPPDSIPKYETAKAAKFEEIKVGDQMNARGEKNAEGTHVSAEEVVFGTFKIAGGTVTAIDPATNTISINDLQTKKPLTIVLKPETVVRRFQMMMGGMGGGAGAGGGGGAPGAGAQGPAAGNGQGQAAANRPAAGGAPGAATGQGAGGAQGPGPGGPRPGGGMNMADMLERMPTISISEIKVGDMIIMSTLPGTDPTRTTAVSMVAGVEPLLQMIAARQAAGGQPRPQNVDLNSNFGGMFGGIGP
jgi:hypothetical protein